MINFNKIKKIFFKFKQKPRFTITKNEVFKNSYYEKKNLIIKFSKIKKKDRDLIKKYLLLSNTKKGKKSFLNWGGGTGVLDFVIKKINPEVETIIIEKKNLIKTIKSKPSLFQKYKNKNIAFSSNQSFLLSDSFDMIIFFGSLCYMSEIYDFFIKSKTKYIAISRLPMAINSHKDFIAYDSFGNHYENFLSYEKFFKILSQNFNFLYFE